MTTPLIEAIARGIKASKKRHGSPIQNAAQAALTAITEAGYEIVHKNYRGDGAYHKAMNDKFHEMATAAQGDG